MSKNENKMMPAEYPFTGYLVSEFYNKKENRYYVGLYPADKESGLKPTTRSKDRYMMSVHLERILKRWEQVDHKNGNCSDDRIENFQILTVGDNNRKQRIQNGTKAIPTDLTCPICGTGFQIASRNYRFHTKRGRKEFCCSRKCGHILTSKKLKGKSNKGIGASKKPMSERKEEIPHNTRKGYAYWKCRCKGCYEAYKAAERARK